MGNPKVAHADALDLARLLCIAGGPPAFSALLRASDAGMEQIQVDVAQPARLQGRVDGFGRRLIGRVGHELRGVVYFGAGDPFLCQESPDGLAAFALVVVPSGGILEPVVICSGL